MMPPLSITHGSWGTSLKPRDLSELVRFVYQSKGDLRSPYSAFRSRSTLPCFMYPGGIFIYTTSSRSQCTKALTASIRKVSSCLLIPTHYEAGLALLQEAVLICLVYEYPHRAEYSLAFRMYLVCFDEGFHLLMGLKVVPLRLLESVSEGVRLKISI